ncbi:hypothetical protein [Pseudoalteromonas denitrificans]|uniref:Uncharacterized protein n=1 Tax=Pseudoalteromonas denitrificans DSM 6059 TaxID=1123010 RepID=A0A1I1EUH9_9GAMM|nr:hypothetical protein [Pseudoalteromonas denitrificans]SFB90342.1 hypothetical protein SAMN02745724_00433 [Pseudoalteromonas denitrificans DSM 6059]
MTSRDLTIQKGRFDFTFSLIEQNNEISYLVVISFDGEEVNQIPFNRISPCSPFLYLLQKGHKVCTLPFVDLEVERFRLWSWNLVSEAMQKRVY